MVRNKVVLYQFRATFLSDTARDTDYDIMDRSFQHVDVTFYLMRKYRRTPFELYQTM